MSRVIQEFRTPDSRLATPDSRLQTPDSRLQTPDSRLAAPDSRLLFTGEGGQTGRRGDQVKVESPAGEFQTDIRRIQHPQVRAQCFVDYFAGTFLCEAFAD